MNRACVKGNHDEVGRMTTLLPVRLLDVKTLK